MIEIKNVKNLDAKAVETPIVCVKNENLDQLQVFYAMHDYLEQSDRMAELFVSRSIICGGLDHKNLLCAKVLALNVLASYKPLSSAEDVESARGQFQRIYDLMQEIIDKKKREIRELLETAYGKEAYTRVPKCQNELEFPAKLEGFLDEFCRINRKDPETQARLAFYKRHFSLPASEKPETLFKSFVDLEKDFASEQQMLQSIAGELVADESDAD